MLFIRLVLVATLLAGTMSWSAAAAISPGQQVVAAGLIRDIILPRESALRMERKVKIDLPTNTGFDSAPAEADAPLRLTQAAASIVPIWAAPHCRWLTFRPCARAPPLPI